ncbi:MAG: hypothetical protein ABIL58_23200 [Pseudomonadota bacterium]
MTPSVNQIVTAMDAKGYTVFRGGRHDLNIVGIRSPNREANRFDDMVAVFASHQNRWLFWAFPATTDPGSHWLQNPMSTLGTAVLAPGQYRSAFRIGKHQGKYDALVQAAPLTVFRDDDRNNKIDAGGKSETGWFGINIHCAAWQGESVLVDKWSAGCQVLASWSDFEIFMAIARSGARFGSTYTYTLLDEAELGGK